MTRISQIEADKKTDMKQISQIGSRLMILLAVALTLAACAGFDPRQLIPPVALGSPSPPATPEPPPTAVLIPPIGQTPVLLCTPPACAPGQSYTCPSRH